MTSAYAIRTLPETPTKRVSLSEAKNLSANPFTEFILSVVEGFRVTILAGLAAPR